MTCDEAKGWIIDRVEGQIGPSDDAALAEHLRSCASCTAVQDEERRATDVIRAKFERAFPAIVPPRLQVPRRIWPAVAAAAFLAFFLGQALSRPDLAAVERIVAASLDREEEIVGFREVNERDGTTTVTELRQWLNGRVHWSREVRGQGETHRVERWGRDMNDLAARVPEAAALAGEAMPLGAYDPAAPYADRLRQLAARSLSKRATSPADARARLASWSPAGDPLKALADLSVP